MHYTLRILLTKFRNFFAKKSSSQFPFRNLTRNQTVLLTHGDSVNTLGEQLEVMGYTSNRIVAALSCEQLKIYGVQFHPEVRTLRAIWLRNIFKKCCSIDSYRLISLPMGNKCSLIFWSTFVELHPTTR